MTEAQGQTKSNNDQLHEQKKRRMMLAFSLANVIKQPKHVHFQCCRKG